jgi:glycosyltransferase involved in cell wall biosynthesis
MRYAWDLREQYLDESGFRGVKRYVAEKILDYVRNWDLSTVERVDRFVANSAYIAERIRRTYGRDATVIYPPVDVEEFLLRREKEDFYLAVSRMVPYKRMDLIVEAFGHLPDRRLVVIGDGPEFEKVKSKASGNVELLGCQPPEALRAHMQRCRALIFAAEEDFGITPVEAQACGTPVIAYGRGGVLETVKEGVTGLFFPEQSPEAVVEAVQAFERQETALDPAVIRANAERFGKERFRREFLEFIERCLVAHSRVLVSSRGEAVQ